MPQLKKTIHDKVQFSLERCAFSRDIRNRRLAHCDLDVRISKRAIPLHTLTCGQIQDALDSLANVVDCVSDFYTQSTTAFNHAPYGRGADALLHFLNAGITATEAMRK